MYRMIKLALVGRPNVGKSSLFNRICKQRISIVDEKPGVTRDRIYGRADFFGKPFDVIDTGGIDPLSQVDFNELIILQAKIAIAEADSLVFVVDGMEGLHPQDYEVGALLRKSGKPVTLAVNKIDHGEFDWRAASFSVLGFNKVVPVSALQGNSIAELLETAFQGFEFEDEVKEERGTRVAIVGRPNVGKSTLLNTLLNEERSVVSDIPGTTRDAVDAKLQHEGKTYTFIDTAGIRRRKAEKDVIDKFAYIRTEEAIARSDVCLLVLDAQFGITTEEKRIASFIEQNRKGCIILLNKWDLAKGIRMEHARKAILEEIPFFEHCPFFCMSASTGRNVEKLFGEIDTVYAEMRKRITTGELNKFVEGCLQRYHPPQIGGKRLRIYYMTQVEASPPHFVLFVNKPELMTASYKKYLINQFREVYGFKGSPLFFNLKGKGGNVLEDKITV